MSSRPGKGQTGEGALCLIGAGVVLVAGSRHPLVERAARRMDFEAAGRTFTALQMGAAFDAAALDDAVMSSGLADFARAAALTQKQQPDLLLAIYGNVAPMFRLLEDERFKAITSELLKGDLPGGTAGIAAIRGIDTVIATVPNRLRLDEDSLVVSGIEKIAIGRVGAVHRFLGHENDKERIAAIDFTSPPPPGPALVITTRGLASLQLSIERYDDLEAFKSAHERSPDHLSLLQAWDSDAAAELGIRARRKKARTSFADPMLGLRFQISGYASMKHGLFLSGWHVDPDGLLESVIAIDHSLAETAVSDVWQCVSAKVQSAEKAIQATRFAAFLPRRDEVAASLATLFRITLTNGENHYLESPRTAQDAVSQRQAILDAIAGSAMDLQTLQDTYYRALAPLQKEINGRQSVRETLEYGIRSSRRASIIIPLYKETGFIRSQLIALDSDPFIRDHCEIVYVLDDPPLAQRIKHILGGAARHVNRLDIKLVILDRNGGYALANNCGVAEADGETIVLMNSDVVPEKSGWLEPLIRRLAALPPSSVAGPKLLYADESLQHAGMLFYRLENEHWQNMHYFKGYGRSLQPANVEREVPAVTGALMVLRKSDYDAVGGFTTDYVIGDYEDSDLCLKLRAEGGTCLYVPSVALFHFERQSMPDSDDRDLGSTVYNRALHTSRWDDAIEALMARFDGACDVL